MKPENRSLCLPSNPEVKHIPMIYSVPGYGSRDHEEYYQEPELEDWVYQGGAKGTEKHHKSEKCLILGYVFHSWQPIQRKGSRSTVQIQVEKVI